MSKKTDSIYSYNSDIDKNAYLNWRIDRSSTLSEKYLIMSEGYFISAQILTEDLLKDNVLKNADCVIFPILFNFIHGIEISLKAILLSLDIIINKSTIPQKMGKHNIKELLSTVLSWLRKNGRGKDARQFIKVKQIIDDIYTKTELMDFPRYPVDAKQNEHFFVGELDNVVVDLEKLRDAIDKCKDVLVRMGHYYEDEIYNMNENY